MYAFPAKLGVHSSFEHLPLTFGAFEVGSSIPEKDFSDVIPTGNGAKDSAQFSTLLILRFRIKLRWDRLQ